MTAPVVIDYPTLLAAATPDDLRALCLIVQGETPSFNTEADRDGAIAMCRRLLNAGLVTSWRMRESWETGDLWWTFDARPAPQVIGYLGQLAVDRITQSRLPIPPTPPAPSP